MQLCGFVDLKQYGQTFLKHHFKTPQHSFFFISIFSKVVGFCFSLFYKKQNVGPQKSLQYEIVIVIKKVEYDFLVLTLFLLIGVGFGFGFGLIGLGLVLMLFCI